jgi:hypothetical protein
MRNYDIFDNLVGQRFPWNLLDRNNHQLVLVLRGIQGVSYLPQAQASPIFSAGYLSHQWNELGFTSSCFV